MLNYIREYLNMPIEFTAISHGKDYVISVKGGSLPHIGSVAICVPGSCASVISVPGHKDQVLALDLANIICNSLHATVTVSVGIHYDKLNKSQIDDIIEVVTNLMDQFLADTKKSI